MLAPQHPAAYGTTRALSIARKDNVAWLVHIDPDEMLSPEGGGEFSLGPELCNAPSHVPAVRFMNAEAVPEAGGITNRYEQVTLFRGHRHAAAVAAQPWRTIFKQGHNAVSGTTHGHVGHAPHSQLAQ